MWLMILKFAQILHRHAGRISEIATLMRPQRRGQLRNVGSDAPSLVSGKAVRCGAPVFILGIDVREHLLIGVSDDNALVHSRRSMGRGGGGAFGTNRTIGLASQIVRPSSSQRWNCETGYGKSACLCSVPIFARVSPHVPVFLRQAAATVCVAIVVSGGRRFRSLVGTRGKSGKVGAPLMRAARRHRCRRESRDEDDLAQCHSPGRNCRKRQGIAQNRYLTMRCHRISSASPAAMPASSTVSADGRQHKAGHIPP